MNLVKIVKIKSPTKRTKEIILKNAIIKHLHLRYKHANPMRGKSVLVYHNNWSMAEMKPQASHTTKKTDKQTIKVEKGM